jgi:hypothetical protein
MGGAEVILKSEQRSSDPRIRLLVKVPEELKSNFVGKSEFSIGTHSTSVRTMFFFVWRSQFIQKATLIDGNPLVPRFDFLRYPSKSRVKGSIPLNPIDVWSPSQKAQKSIDFLCRNAAGHLERDDKRLLALLGFAFR